MALQCSPHLPSNYSAEQLSKHFHLSECLLFISNWVSLLCKCSGWRKQFRSMAFWRLQAHHQERQTYKQLLGCHPSMEGSSKGSTSWMENQVAEWLGHKFGVWFQVCPLHWNKYFRSGALKASAPLISISSYPIESKKELSARIPLRI